MQPLVTEYAGLLMTEHHILTFCFGLNQRTAFILLGEGFTVINVGEGGMIFPILA